MTRALFSSLEKVLLIVSSSIVILQGLILIISWVNIPEVVNYHYNFLGQADAFSGKEYLIIEFFIVLIIHISMFFYILKIKSVYDKTEKSNYKRDRLISGVIDLIVVCIFFYMFICTILKKDVGIGFIPVALISLTVLPGIIYIKKR